MDIRVKYDPAYLSVDMNTGVTLLVEDTGLKIIKENTAGEIIITFSPKDTNINNKNLASIKFKAIKTGTTSLSFGSDTAMLDASYAKLNDIEESLKQSKVPFLRVHQSYLVNYKHVEGQAYDFVVMDNGKRISISEDRRKLIGEQYCSMEDTFYVNE
jgi:hypothetical protein